MWPAAGGGGSQVEPGRALSQTSLEISDSRDVQARNRKEPLMARLRARASGF